MGSLLLQQIPLALGIIMSPLAVVAVVAVLFSDRARINSIAYLIGWFLGIIVSLSVSFAILTALQVHQRTHPPLWVPILHLILGAVLLAGAWFVYTRSHRRMHAMVEATGPGEIAAAAPQLPKMLQSVEHFTPGRSGILGFALFILNPIDMSCAIAAAMNFRLSSATSSAQWASAVVFALVSASSVAVPVALLLIKKEKATEPLQRIRTWIATNTHLLNVGLLILIAAMQISKGIQGL
ncbi:GAP family protein [Rhodococcus sp. KBS0724]|uniref:GAP family protein n=1 Tax=Rhodococcus sp. KBS0724 TaxID=1179674 RepID=UPI00110EE1D6|nr:GAP family protein [Rhodococcus sp. KBS0724]TSD49822.1 GAP family protein [Rhodococcus sp. KBS0724]